MPLVTEYIPWDSQPQEAAELSSLAAGILGAMLLPPVGPISLIGSWPVTLGTGVERLASEDGIGYYSPQAAASAGHRLLVGEAASTLVYVVRFDAAPAADAARGLGGDTINLSWDHANAAFRCSAAAKVGGSWYSASLGSLTGGRTYCIAIQHSSSTLTAVVDGRVVSQVAAAGSVTASYAGYGANAVPSHSRSPGCRTYLAIASTPPIALNDLIQITADPWGVVFAPRETRIWVPSAGGGYTHPTLSNARMGSLTSTGGVPMVDYAF